MINKGIGDKMSFAMWLGIVIGGFIIVYLTLLLFEVMSEYRP